MAIHTFVNLFYSRVFHLGAAQRGFITALAEPGQFLGLAVGFVLMQRAMRRDPGLAMRMIGYTLAGSALSVLGLAVSPTLWLAFIFQFMNAALSAALLPGI